MCGMTLPPWSKPLRVFFTPTSAGIPRNAPKRGAGLLTRSVPQGYLPCS